MLLRVYTSAYRGCDMKEKTGPITVRVTPTIRNRLQALADAERRTLSQFVSLILERFLEEQTTKPSKKKPGD